MERKTTQDRIEFDNETYEITGRTRCAEATAGPAPVVGELQLALIGAVASRDRKGAPHVTRGELPDDLVGLRTTGPIAVPTRRWLH